ncbi:MAG: T9SS type A sorting domain-containing protein [Bacteroidia bacterium]
MNNSTIIDYEIWQNYTNAELRITNVLGQTLFTQKLNKPIDKIQVDGGALSNGIYYYSIIVDGTVSQTKSMSVIH